MDFLTAEIVEGKRKDSKLVWVVEEKYLYYKKDERSDGTVVYLCYHNRINNSSDKQHPCPARRHIDSTGRVTTNQIPHSNHTDHEQLYADLKTRSGIIQSCIQTASALEGLHVTVPTQKIFTRELAK